MSDVTSIFGERLRGARLFRGYALAEHAALALGQDARAYAAAEGSDRLPRPKIVRALAGWYGVTAAYLQAGRISTVMDRNADEHVGLPDPGPRTWTISQRDEVARRLKALRLARGFRTSSQAAICHGWLMEVYSELEGGRRVFTQEMIETYSLAYGAPREFFLDNQVALPRWR